MTPASTSSLSDINAALRDQSPFADAPIATASTVWKTDFPDVKSFNSHASDTVLQALKGVKLGHYAKTSVLITAQNGTGKTHVISRIRHHLKSYGGALFVYANQFDDLNRAEAGFQQILASSLNQLGSQDVRQWQELAAAMANDALKSINPNAQSLSAKDLVNKFDNSSEDQVYKWVSQLTKAYCRSKVVENPDIVKAIFWTLSEEVLYASNWLGGKEIAQFKSNELRLPTQNQSFDAVIQILTLISEYNQLLICFDELDKVDCNDAGLSKAQVVANLVKELYDNLKRGVILTVIMPGVWNEGIKQLPESTWARLKAQCEPIALKYMDVSSIAEIISFRLKDFYDSRKLIPPTPIYPFTESQIQELSTSRSTIREVLDWCRKNCKVLNDETAVQSLLPSPVEVAFINERDEDISNYLDDNYFLADSIFFGFKALIGQEVEGVLIEEINAKVSKKGKKNDYLNFKIWGKEVEKDVAIGVAVLQYDGGHALGAGLRKLLDNEGQFSLTRGCLVRSKDKPISRFLKDKYLDPLVQKGGEFVELKENEIKPLIAIYSVFLKSETDYKVTENEIFEFIREKGERYWLGSYNPLLREILSDPSYQFPDDIQDEPELEVLPEDDSEPNDLQELMLNV